MKALIILLLFQVVMFVNCDNRYKTEISDESKTEIEEDEVETNLTTIKIAGKPLKVEVVQDAETRALGLMHREKLPENQGMLFVFEEPQVLSFWMRNTFIPLDIAFIDENGEIVDIQRMEPLDETKQYISREPGLYALEVNAGWFEKNAIKVGSNVSF